MTLLCSVALRVISGSLQGDIHTFLFCQELDWVFQDQELLKKEIVRNWPKVGIKGHFLGGKNSEDDQIWHKINHFCLRSAHLG